MMSDSDFINKYITRMKSRLDEMSGQILMLETRLEVVGEAMQVKDAEVQTLKDVIADMEKEKIVPNDYSVIDDYVREIDRLRGDCDDIGKFLANEKAEHETTRYMVRELQEQLQRKTKALEDAMAGKVEEVIVKKGKKTA